MLYTKETQARLELWRKELTKHFYIETAPLEFQMAKADTLLDIADVEKLEFSPAPEGTKWGEAWQYAWFKTELVVPESLAGKPLALNLKLTHSVLIYIDGCVRNSRSQFVVTDCAEVGRKYSIMIEACIHPKVYCSTGPVPPERLEKFYEEKADSTVGKNTFGEWNEEAFQLFMDFETLYLLRESVGKNEPHSVLVELIDRALKQFTIVVDFEADRATRDEQYKEARALFAPLLEKTNGSSAPIMHAVGQGHLDIAWLWSLDETRRKNARTIGNQLDLIERYRNTDFSFLWSQPMLHEQLNKDYPELFERFKEAVLQGRIIADGASWVEMDTNVPSGESLIRQFIYGKRYFKDEYNIDSRVLWLPDVFGYTGALPQIMKKCEVDYFTTSKLYFSYKTHDPFPYNTFTWQGIDGTEIPSHIYTDYVNEMDPKTLNKTWNARRDRDESTTRLYSYGYGDGGGGPTRNHVEFALRAKDLEHTPKVVFSTPQKFFEDLTTRGEPRKSSKYVGELYFPNHRGTLTAQAKTKLLHRMSEVALFEAERWSALLNVLQDEAYPTEMLDAAWKTVLLAEFHDILPGSSVVGVYEDTEPQLAELVESTDAHTKRAQSNFVTEGDGLVVFNSAGFNQTTIIELPEEFSGASVNGEALPIQKDEDGARTEVTVPPMGMLTIEPSDVASPATEDGASITDNVIQNKYLRVEFDSLGRITSAINKLNSQEMIEGFGNDLALYADVPNRWDAWDIDEIYKEMRIEENSPAEIKVLRSGPLLAELEITRKINNSHVTQIVSLGANSKRLEFATKVDWQERHKMLKVRFDTNIMTSDATYGIQFGHINRPTHTSRLYDADRYECSFNRYFALAEEGRGVAMLCDHKYGASTEGGTLSMTLLRASMAPDKKADVGTQEFTYALHLWAGSFFDSEVVLQSHQMQESISCMRGHAESKSFFSVDTPNIILETIKLAEDGSGDMILRLYEAKRTASNCVLSTTLDVKTVAETNMLENEPTPLTLEGGAVKLAFKAFEVKTLRLSF